MPVWRVDGTLVGWVARVGRTGFVVRPHDGTAPVALRFSDVTAVTSDQGIFVDALAPELRVLGQAP